MPEPLLKPADVARILGLSRSATYAFLRSGVVPVIEVTKGTIRLRAAVLEEYLKKRTVAARPGRPLKVYGAADVLTPVLPPRWQ